MFIVHCWFCNKELDADKGESINGGVVHPGTWCDGICKDKYFKEIHSERYEQEKFLRGE